MTGLNGKKRKEPPERNCPEGPNLKCDYELLRGAKDHNMWFGFWKCVQCGDERMTIENDSPGTPAPG